MTKNVTENPKLPFLRQKKVPSTKVVPASRFDPEEQIFNHIDNEAIQITLHDNQKKESLTSIATQASSTTSDKTKNHPSTKKPSSNRFSFFSSIPSPYETKKELTKNVRCFFGLTPIKKSAISPMTVKVKAKI